jgi:hypothetical protein
MTLGTASRGTGDKPARKVLVFEQAVLFAEQFVPPPAPRSSERTTNARYDRAHRRRVG